MNTGETRVQGRWALLRDQGDEDELSRLLPELKALSEEIKDLNEKKTEAEELLREFLLNVPNMPDSSVPEGPDDTANVEIRKWGEPRDFDFEVKDHVLLGDELDILDLPRATKIAGRAICALQKRRRAA